MSGSRAVTDQRRVISAATTVVVKIGSSSLTLPGGGIDVRRVDELVDVLSEVVNTDGGPRRNEKAQILDVDGEPIPNLYSSGEFGSIWAAKYQGSGNITECMVFGRIAARELIAKK